MTITWNVKPIGQSSIRLCWEACGHMLWNWRYRADPVAQGNYRLQAGAYATLDRGLTPPEMDKFYKLLGLRSLADAKGENIHYALKWSPVIAFLASNGTGHAIVVDGFGGQNYMLINPCGVQAVTFDSDANEGCTVGSNQMNRRDFDADLGSMIWYW